MRALALLLCLATFASAQSPGTRAALLSGGTPDPLRGTPFTVRLQAFRGFGSRAFEPFSLYKDADCTDPATQEGDVIYSWRDELSGSGIVMQQATLSKRPTLHFERGRPTVRFTYSGQQTLTSSATVTTATQHTAYLVLNRQYIANYQMWLTIGNALSGGSINVINREGTPIDMTSWAPGISNFAAGSIDTFRCAVQRGGSKYVTCNGVLVASGGESNLTSITNNIMIGPQQNGAYCGADITAAIITAAPYNRGIDDLMSVLTPPYESGFSTYAMATFYSDQKQQMHMLTSGDGTTWNTVQPVTYVSHIIRDPSIEIVDGVWWCAHTAQLGNQTTFELLTSADGKAWTRVGAVDMSAAGGNRVWAPEVFTDSDGTHRVYVSISAAGDGGPFVIYETHATNAGRTTWSTPVAVTGSGFPVSMIDAMILKVGATYWMFYKNETAKYIEIATSTSPTSGFTVVKTLNALGFGTNLYEGPSVVPLATGGYRMFIDRYNNQLGVYYSDSADLLTWSAPAPIVGDGSKTRHGTVIRMP